MTKLDLFLSREWMTRKVLSQYAAKLPRVGQCLTVTGCEVCGNIDTAPIVVRSRRFTFVSVEAGATTTTVWRYEGEIA